MDVPEGWGIMTPEKEAELKKRGRVIDGMGFDEILPLSAVDVQREKDILEKNRQAIEALCKELNVPHRVLVGQPPPPAKFIGGGSTLHFRKGDYEIVVDFPHSPGMSMKKVQDFWSLQLDHFIEYMTNPIKVKGEEYVSDNPIVKEANEDGTKSSSNG